MTAPWLNVIGIGEDGLAGLSESAKALLSAAELVVGGARHHEMVAGAHQAEVLTWDAGLQQTFNLLEAHKGKRIVIVASGDPMCFGVGSSLKRRFGRDALSVIPGSSAFSLACARLKWSLPDVATFTIHGRPVQKVNLHIAPGARLVMLCRDGQSPAEVAALLTEKGYGDSRLWVLERMGGDQENILEGTAASWSHDTVADLNTLAVECIAGSAAKQFSRAPGLDDDLFDHDGQLTKAEVRAVTLCALAPVPNQVLWDVGAGSGSIAIEWLRLNPTGRAVAVEKDHARLARIARNAAALGMPELEIIAGEAPDILPEIKRRPDVIFAGGGVSVPGVLESCWDALKPGGRLVANAVTLEAEQALLAFRAKNGGTFIRIAISREENVGRLTTLKPMAPVLQYRGLKP